MSVTDRLDEIEARATAATEGPWRPSHERPSPGTRPDWSYDVWDDGGVDVVGNGVHPDTVFIAHARQDVPALVVALRAALNGLDQISEAAAYGHNVGAPVSQGQRSWDAEQVRAAIEAALGGDSR